MRLAARSALALAVVLLLATCSSPTEPPIPPGGEPPPPPPGGGPLPPMTGLELTLNDSLQVGGYAWLRVTARADNGAVVAPTHPIVYTISDASIATVSSEGVILGKNRGVVTVTATSGSVHASLALTVRARIGVALARGPALGSYRIAVGDTLPLAATFVDINGVPIDGTAAPGEVTWTSSNPAAVTVDEAGRVVGQQPDQEAVVTVTSAGEGSAATNIVVDVVEAGLPARVRFAHAAPGLGPVTFHHSRGEAVTLSAGQLVDLATGSGFFYVTLEGAPGQAPLQPWTALIQPDAKLSLYAVGQSSLYLSPMWGPFEVRDDMGQVRLVQGSSYLVVYLRPSGAPIDGLPEQCYFDPSLSSPHYNLEPGPFDIFLQAKYEATDSVRLAANAPAGQPMTLVLTGNSAATAGYMTFPDN